MPELIRSGFFIGKKEDDLHFGKWKKRGQPQFFQMEKTTQATILPFQKQGQARF